VHVQVLNDSWTAARTVCRVRNGLLVLLVQYSRVMLLAAFLLLLRVPLQLINRLSSGDNQFGLEEVRRLRNIFSSVAGDKNSALNRNEFMTSLGRAFPLLMKEKKIVLSLFDAFDVDNRLAGCCCVVVAFCFLHRTLYVTWPATVCQQWRH